MAAANPGIVEAIEATELPTFLVLGITQKLPPRKFLAERPSSLLGPWSAPSSRGGPVYSTIGLAGTPARAGAAQAAASHEQRVHSRGLLLLLIIYERDLAIRVCIYSFTIHS